VLTADTLRAAHFMLGRHDLAHGPGRWRVGQDGVDDQPGPESSRVPALLAELLDQANAPDTELLLRAALVHLNLAVVRPFGHGNGRLARYAHTLLLTSGSRVTAPEFAAVEEEFAREPDDYRRVLAEVTGGGWPPERDPGHWVRFCLTAHYRHCRRLSARAELTARLWALAEQAVAPFDLPERAVQPLVFALGGRWLRNATYRQLAPDLSKNLASRDLNELVKAGVLEPVGEKRGRRYQPAGALRTAAAAARAEVDAAADLDADPYQVAIPA
jgi:hypothetical protein